jgi:hypothetical protein
LDEPSRVVGPSAEELFQKSLDAANAADQSTLRAYSTAACWGDECGGLAKQAPKKFKLKSVGTVVVSGRRAAGGADVMCTPSNKCDFIYLLLELVASNASEAGISSRVAVWRVADVTEDEQRRAVWLSEGSGASPERAPPPKLETTPPSSAEKALEVVSSMQAGFRRCYARGLATDPTIGSGALKVRIEIGKTGAVKRATASTTGSMPASVLRCMEARAQAAQFDPPAGGSAIVVVPVNFVRP